ncbi:MAG: hypothetical protein JKY94_10855, partial [Rhodobacteraceae bacterium]|nr:hypothetical protein [Paracoccaceae bacterium]
ENHPNGYVQPNTDYTLLSQTYDAATSFGGQAYYSATDNRLVISFQGTAGGADLALTDLYVGLTGSFTNQSAISRTFTQQVLQSFTGSDAEIVFVGHSLGGFLAQENLLFLNNTTAN